MFIMKYYIHNEIFPTIKNKAVLFTKKWVCLEIVKASTLKPCQEDKCHVFFHLWILNFIWIHKILHVYMT